MFNRIVSGVWCEKIGKFPNWKIWKLKNHKKFQKKHDKHKEKRTDRTSRFFTKGEGKCGGEIEIWSEHFGFSVCSYSISLSRYVRNANEIALSNRNIAKGYLEIHSVISQKKKNITLYYFNHIWKKRNYLQKQILPVVDTIFWRISTEKTDYRN